MAFVTVLVPQFTLCIVDQLVARGLYASRSAAIRERLRVGIQKDIAIVTANKEEYEQFIKAVQQCVEQARTQGGKVYMDRPSYKHLRRKRK